MRFLLAMAVTGSLMTTAAFAQAPRGPATPPVVGVVTSFDGTALVVDANDGMAMSSVVTQATRITVSVPKTIADIKPGDFIASGGTVGPDGKLRANEIRIFPAPAGEGQFPMSQPGQTMTNATVTQVMTNATVQQLAADGNPVIKLTFHGAGAPGSANCAGRAADAPGGAGTGCLGETEFEVPADVPIVAQVPGDASILPPGPKVSMNAAKTSDGLTAATRITILQ